MANELPLVLVQYSSLYHMVGNFHGVLISLLLWFIRQSRKLPSTKINVCTAVCAEGGLTGAWPKHRGSVAHTVLNNKLSLCRPADGVFDSSPCYFSKCPHRGEQRSQKEQDHIVISSISGKKSSSVYHWHSITHL